MIPHRFGLCLAGAFYQVAVIAWAAFGLLSPPITFQSQLLQRGPTETLQSGAKHTHTPATAAHANTAANSIFKHG